MSSFRTEINVPNPDFRINHQDRILAYGSCFAENMSDKLKWFRFDVHANSHGIVFNPFSVAKALDDVLQQRFYGIVDLKCVNGIYHSMDHHGRFGDADAELVCSNINREIDSIHVALHKADVLLITFGTAWYYRFNETNKIVANCHKLPGSAFVKEIARAEEIVSVWKALIKRLKQDNPNLKLVFTVSPVRHLRDGFHENQLSKANLLLAVDELCQTCDSVYYFPAYEILIDDLRDYRFCAEDMVHPSHEAIAYIWEKFMLWVMDEPTLKLLSALNPLLKYLDHRPLKVSIDHHEVLLRQKEQEISQMITQFRSMK